jgi:hypothetical protein
MDQIQTDLHILTQVLKLKLNSEFIYKGIVLCRKDIFEMVLFKLGGGGEGGIWENGIGTREHKVNPNVLGWLSKIV